MHHNVLQYKSIENYAHDLAIDFHAFAWGGVYMFLYCKTIVFV